MAQPIGLIWLAQLAAGTITPEQIADRWQMTVEELTRILDVTRQRFPLHGKSAIH
jgi:hypothetical protein